MGCRWKFAAIQLLRKFHGSVHVFCRPDRSADYSKGCWLQAWEKALRLRYCWPARRCRYRICWLFKVLWGQRKPLFM